MTTVIFVIGFMMGCMFGFIICAALTISKIADERGLTNDNNRKNK